MGEPATERVTATAAALEVITRLEAAHGPLMFFQSGGCCEGTAPICLRDEEALKDVHFVTGTRTAVVSAQAASARATVTQQGASPHE
ncbi:MAG: DUF779 domain-containing protein [Solirubrobacteraceae bacterium]